MYSPFTKITYTLSLLPSRFGTVSQSYLRCCLPGFSPHTGPNKTSLTTLILFVSCKSACLQSRLLRAAICLVVKRLDSRTRQSGSESQLFHDFGELSCVSGLGFLFVCLFCFLPHCATFYGIFVPQTGIEPLTAWSGST